MNEGVSRRSEEIETLMNVVPAAVWVAHDPECKVITGNRMADNFYEARDNENVSAGPTTGEEWNKTRRFFKDGRELRPEELPMQVAAASGEEVRGAELEVLLPSGSKIVILGNAIPLLDENGKVRGSAASFIDITDRKRAEEALKESEEQFRSTLDNMIEGCQIIGHDWRYIYINDAAERHNRRPKEELLGKKYQDVWPGIEETIVFDILKKCMKERVPREMENEFVFPDGKIGWFELRISPVQEGIFILSSDITERKRADKALRDSEARYRGMFKNTKDTVTLRQIIFDNGEIVDTIILDANRAALKAWGFGSIEQVKGKRSSDLFSRAVVETQIASIKEAVSQDAPHTSEVTYGDREYLSTFIPLGEDLVLVSSSDITEIKNAQKSAEEFAKSLRRSNEELRQFAYVASHDLQEPLRMVSSYIGLLQRRYGNHLDERAKEYMNFALQGSERMRELIEDLLEYSRVDTKGKAFELVDMNEVINRALLALKVQIKESNAKIEVGKMPTIMIDDGQMIQLFQNLISNAIKFRREEPPRVKISYAQTKGGWIFAVKDNGIGIAPMHQNKIFEVFQRLHSTDEYPGTGIGLAIAKKIVERHGGVIWVRSQAGKGATFYFSIPDSDVKKGRHG